MRFIAPAKPEPLHVRTPEKSGLLNNSFVNQQDRNVVSDRIDAPAFGALETLAFVFQHQPLLAERANQDIEYILGQHNSAS
jgi:hypothetical protein